MATEVPAQVTAAESDAQDALRRADSKATTLLSLVGATLAGGIALSTRDMPAVSAVLLWLALVPVFASVVLLLLTLLPKLGQAPVAGTWLFAAQVGPGTLLETCTGMDAVAVATHACVVARIARSKYRRVQVAVALLVVGLAVLVLSVLVWAVS